MTRLVSKMKDLS